MKNINLLMVIPNNNKHTHDFDNIYNKSIDFINHSNVIQMMLHGYIIQVLASIQQMINLNILTLNMNL